METLRNVPVDDRQALIEECGRTPYTKSQEYS
jgi:hypothetical protein